jgi:hypothetical protein
MMKSLSELLAALEQAGVRLGLRDGDISVRPVSSLTAELLEQIRARKDELVEYLGIQGEEVVGDPVEQGHADMHTPPRSAAEVDNQRADADRELERSRRLYQGGALLVNRRRGYALRELYQAPCP